MLLSPRSSSEERRRNDRKFGNLRTKKKHKRLDAICERTFTQNHSGIERFGSSECNVGETEAEVRRSTRVRRAPEILDASPTPKKRRKIDKGRGLRAVNSVKRERRVKSESPCSNSRNFRGSEWRLRLRSRSGDKCVKFGARRKDALSIRGKRKLFEDMDRLSDETRLRDDKFAEGKEGLSIGKSTVVKSKRRGRVEASNVPSIENQELNLIGGENHKGVNGEVLEVTKGSNGFLLKGETRCRSKEEVRYGRIKHRSKGNAPVHMSEDCLPETVSRREQPDGNDKAETMDQDLKEDKQIITTGENLKNAVDTSAETAGPSIQAVSVSEPPEGDSLAELNKKSALDTISSKPRVKEGRRCGLCGQGTDGKPPKTLVQDSAESDNGVHSGSSASEEPNYDIWDGFGDEPGWLGHLLGPINDRFGIAGIWVHQQCAVWSPEVYFAGLGCLKNVRAALFRGRVLKCSRCGRPGATIGCRVDRCPKTYHLPCARANGCIFDHRKFLIACTDHRRLFQPHGSQFSQRIKKMKAKKMRVELRKVSNDAWRKDIEAEEKWLENCGEDEEFLRRESKRLHRDLLRVTPVYIGGSNSDNDIKFQGWESVAGLQDVIQCMKEVVILPLLYPEFFSSLGLTPPRGVLLHGYPGTGKTLVVRALVGACARGDKRIAYFARKGADCLGKYVGDAERQLRLLFQVAEKSQPSIIFFDEIDGLAPSRTGQQDQTHISVVSTLLSLMDGLKSRGSVVVIGATNRPDAVDPALRRPGRFDREIYFPLPAVDDREAILSLHTQKWPKPVSGPLLKWIARNTVGFAGADLRALCTEAAIIALKRNFPLHKHLSEVVRKPPHDKHTLLPYFTVDERDWLEALSQAPPPCSRREAGMSTNDVVALPLQTYLLPCLLEPLCGLLVSLYLDERLWLPPPVIKAVTLIKNVIVSVLDRKKFSTDNWWSHLHNLLQGADVTCEIENGLMQANLLIESDNFVGCDALEDKNDIGFSMFGLSKTNPLVKRSNVMQNVSLSLQRNLGYQILISGNPGSGQRHLASCLLHCFIGYIQVWKVDLAAIYREGLGDAVVGLTQILLRFAGNGSCLVFMPRIDLWATENFELTETESNSEELPHNTEVVNEGKLHDSEETRAPSESIDSVKRSSYLWNSFIEQISSGRAASTMILATSDVPIEELPSGIRDFFKFVPGEPRFPVQVDGNFDSDMMLDSSAEKLSKDLSRLFVQLIYYRNHISMHQCKDDKSSDTAEDDVHSVVPNSDPPVVIENESKRFPVGPVTADALNSKTVKGKSSLMQAISAFGYQILQYPHFAELCWFTSKLKEGPCTNINGPWKGWPFNSCIVRPDNSMKVSIASGSNFRRKETSDLVRGLIAVGLSAFRGEYASLREVSSEVRKVQELLVARIYAKIQAGKDRYRFARILSQVAYLDDMVNSWAYSLRSLEDARLSDVNSKYCDGLAGGSNSSSGTLKANELPVCDQTLDGLQLHEENSKEGDASNIGSEGTTGDGDFGSPLKFNDLLVQNGKTPNLVILDNPSPNAQVPNFKESSSSLEARMLEEIGNHTNTIGDGGSVKHDSIVARVADDTSEDGDNTVGSRPEIGSSVGGNDVLSQTDNQKLDGGNNETRCTSNKCKSFQTDLGQLCCFLCCSKCLVNLRHLLRQIVCNEWGVKGSNCKLEDFHDFVSLLSVNLHSAVRKILLVESQYYSVDESLMQDKYSKHLGCWKTCKSQNPGSKISEPMDCCCHSLSSNLAEASLSQNSRSVPDAKIIFKDGVLATLDSNKDVPFHCKFERLCLCSLIECILMN